MYMDYSKLWKHLIDKNMTKTELMDETGLSSRIIAKLSKNEVVTTETLAKICACLNCDVADIMECKEDESLSIYSCYKKFGVITEDAENYKTVKFEYNGQKYKVYAIKKPEKKNMIIHLMEDGTIYREELLPFGHIMCPSRVKTAILKVTPTKNETVIVLFTGKPNFFGIDDGIFISAKNKNKTPSNIYVMTEASFKLFNA